MAPAFPATIADDSHHLGQIALALKQNGMRLPDKPSARSRQPEQSDGSALPACLPLYFLPYLFHLLCVFPKPRQLDSEAALYEAAIKILVRRAHSVYEMKQALERRSEDAALVKTVMARLKSAGLLDDALYASQFARQRTEGRKQGKFRVARDLRARGVSDRHIEAALAQTAQQTDEARLIRQRIERRRRTFRGEIDDKKLASLYRSLLRAGFSADVIRRELKSFISEDLPNPDADL